MLAQGFDPVCLLFRVALLPFLCNKPPLGNDKGPAPRSAEMPSAVSAGLRSVTERVPFEARTVLMTRPVRSDVSGPPPVEGNPVVTGCCSQQCRR